MAMSNSSFNMNNTMANTKLAMKKVRGNLERLFDKNLADLIRGIRNNKDNEAKYIGACVEEIKAELRQDNIAVKTNAVAKLTYLQMRGYDISWASFNVIEVMASARFTDKRVGYLAAQQSFSESTDVLMLTTNMIRKDLHSTGMYEAGTALGSLSVFITPDLARDLANDVVTLLSSSRPYVRKRAVLVMYKVFLKYPDALRPTFPRLKERLEDPDPGVQSAAVNVICELARKNPKNYLSLAPVFFKLMTSSTNNWMLIKIIKLFGALVTLEPRLGKKLLEPLTNLINSTSAMSLLYECINTVIAVLISVAGTSGGDHTASIQGQKNRGLELCVQKLGVLIEDADQNLKYLGLLAMARILKTHPKAVQAHKDIVLSCLEDKDESIRLRALDLVYGMVSRKNVEEIVGRLMSHVEAAEGSAYRDELLQRILSISSHDNYHYISNFEWYVSVLVELTKVEGTRHGAAIAAQMQDVAVRVHSIRHFAVSQMALLIENAGLLLAGSAQQRSNVSEVLLAAAWIVGEYAEHVGNPQSVLEAMLRTKLSLMPGHIQSTFVQNIGKLYAKLLEEAEKEGDWDAVLSLDNLLLSKMPQFEQTDHLEAQERACSLVQLMKAIEPLHNEQIALGPDFAALFTGELNPVAPKAQRKVPVPAGLDLDEWINEPPPSSSEEEEEEEEAPSPVRPTNAAFAPGFGQAPFVPETRKEDKKAEPTKEEMKKMKAAREAEYESNPHYLKPSKSSHNDLAAAARPGTLGAEGRQSSRSTPADAAELASPLEIPGLVGLDTYTQRKEQTMSWKEAKKAKKKGKKKRRKSSSDEDDSVVHEVNRGAGEMPDDAKSTDDEDEAGRKAKGIDDDFRALDINLDEPLRDDERLPVAAHRVASPDEAPASLKASKKKHKKDKDRGEKKEKKVKKHKKKREESPTDAPTSNGVHEEKKVDEDLDFWLSGASAEPTTSASPPPKTQPTIEEPAKEEKKKRKKSSSGKEKSTKSKSRKAAAAAAEEATKVSRDRSDYEVASGVCTPSKHNSNAPTPQPLAPSPLPPMQELSASNLLAEDAHVKMMYTTSVSTADAHQITATVVLSNVGADETVERMEFNVLDSLNAKFMRDQPAADAGNKIPFDLTPGLANEHTFRFAVESVNVPQRLRGTLTYMLKTPSGAVPEKLDFALRFPCTAFTIPSTLSKDAFSQLLGSGELGAKATQRLASAQPLPALLHRLALLAHFTVVESADDCASLYSQTIQAEPICLLLKIQEGEVIVDGKAREGSLLTAVMDEVKAILSN